MGHEVGRGHRLLRREGVVDVHEHIGDVGEHRLSPHRRRHVEAHALPAVHDRHVGASRRDLGDGIPRFHLVHDDVEVGSAGAQGVEHRGHDATHRGGEGREPQQPRRAPALSLQP